MQYDLKCGINASPPKASIETVIIKVVEWIYGGTS
jgi:hypothetical protein